MDPYQNFMQGFFSAGWSSAGQEIDQRLRSCPKKDQLIVHEFCSLDFAKIETHFGPFFIEQRPITHPLFNYKAPDADAKPVVFDDLFQVPNSLAISYTGWPAGSTDLYQHERAREIIPHLSAYLIKQDKQDGLQRYVIARRE